MGKLYIVGIGPGDHDNMTIGADRILQGCDVIAGYTVYVDLVKDLYPGKQLLSTGMTKEAQRCAAAIEKAREGFNVALVCSGDSGIYGMAALAYELRGENKEPAIEVIPGLTAAASGAALLGAPLTHDFTVISLSDRLTKWETIENRLRAAAAGDFSIAIYNPVSKSRKTHLKKACEILLEQLPPDRICGVARNIGREGESWRILSLDELKDAQLDMFCTVFVGNSMTKIITDKMITPRGYLTDEK